MLGLLENPNLKSVVALLHIGVDNFATIVKVRGPVPLDLIGAFFRHPTRSVLFSMISLSSLLLSHRRRTLNNPLLRRPLPHKFNGRVELGTLWGNFLENVCAEDLDHQFVGALPCGHALTCLRRHWIHEGLGRTDIREGLVHFVHGRQRRLGNSGVRSYS